MKARTKVAAEDILGRPLAVDRPAVKLMTADATADMLLVSKATLYAWRYKGTGPRAYRIGKELRYSESDVIDWLETRASGGQPAAS